MFFNIWTFKHFIIFFVFPVLINVYSMAPDLRPANDKVCHYVQENAPLQAMTNYISAD